MHLHHHNRQANETKNDRMALERASAVQDRRSSKLLVIRLRARACLVLQQFVFIFSQPRFHTRIPCVSRTGSTPQQTKTAPLVSLHAPPPTANVHALAAKQGSSGYHSSLAQPQTLRSSLAQQTLALVGRGHLEGHPPSLRLALSRAFHPRVEARPRGVRISAGECVVCLPEAERGLVCHGRGRGEGFG